MKILIIDNGSMYLDYLKQLVSGHLLTIKKYNEIVSTDNKNYDLIILSGGHNLSVIKYEEEFSKEIALIRESTTPILGICLGFELIAHCFGATLLRMHNKEKIILTISKELDDPLFQAIGNINVYESHRWVVTQVGQDLISLAKSKDGIEIIKHKEKLIYGFQFHPEMFEDQTQGDELFANFMKIVQNRAV